MPTAQPCNKEEVRARTHTHTHTHQSNNAHRHHLHAVDSLQIEMQQMFAYTVTYAIAYVSLRQPYAVPPETPGCRSVAGARARHRTTPPRARRKPQNKGLIDMSN